MMIHERVIIDLGCNNRSLDGKAGVIRVDLVQTAPDMVQADFNKPPLPFPDNYADEVHCYHVLEHLEDAARFLEEIYRISKPSADVHIGVPHYTSPVAWGDPSHKRCFSLLYFYYFGHKFHYRNMFRVLSSRFVIMPTTVLRYQDQSQPGVIKKLIAGVLHFIPNKLPPLIADRLGWLFGGYHEVTVDLKVNK